MISLLDPLTIFTVITISLVSTLLSVTLIHPFATLIVRYRTNHTPRGLSLPPESAEEDGVDPATVQSRVGPVVNGLWAMGKRVKGIEGWKGFYKGYMPTLIISVDLSILATIISLVAIPRGRSDPITPPGPLVTFVALLLLILLILPVEIFINRAITTPHQLGSFAAKRSVRTLLTTYERRGIWRLYLTPGLVLSRVLILFWTIVVMRAARMVLLPDLPPGSLLSHLLDPEHKTKISSVRLTLLILFSAASTAILCPLEVMATRLAMQRNHPTTDGGYVQTSTEDPGVTHQDEDQETEEITGEVVVALRDENDPYTGLVDCAKRITAEEGVGTLYRVWWVTMIGAIIASLG